MKLLKILFIGVLVLAGFFWIKAHQPSMKDMYPEQCWFLIDDQFSELFQQKIKDYVVDKYHAYKDPNKILEDVALQFTEISSMDAYICKIDKMCFTFDGARPMFILNNNIVDSNLHMINKLHYRNDIVQGLYTITSTNSLALQDIMKFTQMVPLSIFQEFDVVWHNSAEVFLQSKKNKHEQLLFSMQNVPTLEDVSLFKELQKNMSNNKKKSKIFDFRFHNQVIVK